MLWIDKLKKVISVLLVIVFVCPALSIGSAYSNTNYEVVKGIVEENNPDLGYITLFNEDGTGIKDSYQRPWILRTYNYFNANDIEVFKDHIKGTINDVEAGDTVFIRLGENNKILSISAANNYIPRYGIVISKSSTSIAIEYDDGIQQVLELNDDILVIEDGRLSEIDRLKSGDRVKLILQITDRYTKIKEITIGTSSQQISNIYKGVISRVDLGLNRLILQNLQTFQRNSWRRAEKKGFTSIKLSDKCKIFFNNRPIDLRKVSNYLRHNEVYIAAEETYGNEESAVLVSFRNQYDTEVLYNDIINKFTPSLSRFFLNTVDESIGLDEGTIIVKDGKLVQRSNIPTKEKAYVVANRDYSSGQYNAGIVYLKERYDRYSPQIYRGRIKNINEEKDFTLNSFSQLKGLNWEYSNTPKTFDITYDTRILGENGVIGTQDFIGYGEQSFVDNVVYVVADGINAILVSTAPYGTINVRGEILKIEVEQSEEGIQTEEVSEVSIKNGKVYASDSYLWESKDVINLKILKNSIIIKDNKVVKAASLKKGDIVRAIKKEISQEGEGYIVIVEE
jgi:hypothetical protein